MQTTTTTQNGNGAITTIERVASLLKETSTPNALALNEQAQAAKTAIEHHKGFVNTIDCAEAYQIVATELLSAKAELNRLDNYLERRIKPWQAVRAIALEEMHTIEREAAPYKAYLQTSVEILKGEAGRYLKLESDRKEREEREERKRREAEARLIAAEAARIQAAAAEKSLRKQQEAVVAANRGNHQAADQLRAEAERNTAKAAEESQLRLEEAEAIREMPVVATKHAAQNVKGISTPRSYEAVLVDFDAALRGVLAGKTPKTDILKRKPVQTVTFNMSWFQSEAVRLGQHFDYPGFEARPTFDVSVRA